MILRNYVGTTNFPLFSTFSSVIGVRGRSVAAPVPLVSRRPLLEHSFGSLIWFFREGGSLCLAWFELLSVRKASFERWRFLLFVK